MFRFAAAAAAGYTLIAGGAAAQTAPVPDARAIFASARSAWAFTSYPRYANYRVGVRYQNDGVAVARHYATLEDLRRDIVFAQSFSSEETANPSFPARGINFGILGMTLNKPQPADPVGPLALAITYDFGLSLANRPTQVAQMGSEITAPDRYPVIGRSGTTALIYDVRLIETLEDGATYHLALTPVRDPRRYRVREMWVDSKTFVTKKILIAANFARAPYTDVPWLVTFRQIDGGPYIVQEQAQGQLDFGRAGTLSNLTISFDGIASTSALPRYGTVGINGGSDEFVTEP